MYNRLYESAAKYKRTLIHLPWFDSSIWPCVSLFVNHKLLSYRNGRTDQAGFDVSDV